MKTEFIKMHGIGNDYVFIDCIKGKNTHVFKDTEEKAALLSDRHFGIGSDGLILIADSVEADFKMMVFNSDGSQAQMCGNAIRCVAKYVFETGYTNKKINKIETLAGIKTTELIFQNSIITEVRVDMGIPVTGRLKEFISLGEKNMEFTPVSMGNPHAVFFTEDLIDFPVTSVGPAVERHENFPERTNVEFVQILNRNRIKMRVWERGAGETLACGTGACAAVSACILNGSCDEKVEVSLKGGVLGIEKHSNGHIYMTGPAVEVFRGYINL